MTLESISHSSLRASSPLPVEHSKFPELTLHDVKRGKTDADRDWTLYPIHAQTFVETFFDSFCFSNMYQRAHHSPV